MSKDETQSPPPKPKQLIPEPSLELEMLRFLFGQVVSESTGALLKGGVDDRRDAYSKIQAYEKVYMNLFIGPVVDPTKIDTKIDKNISVFKLFKKDES